MADKLGPNDIQGNAAEDPAAFIARVDAARKYRPSEEAMLLARIYDLEPRAPWEVESSAEAASYARVSAAENGASAVEIERFEREAILGWPTDLDRQNAAALLGVLVRAFQTGEREVLARLREATALLRGDLKPNETKKRDAMFAQWVHDSAKNARLQEPRYIRSYVAAVRNGWSHHLDPAFESLDLDVLRDELLGIEADEAKLRKGGAAGRVHGAAHAAATIAIAVNAFGYGDRDHDLLREQFQQARSKYKGQP